MKLFAIPFAISAALVTFAVAQSSDIRRSDF